MTTPAMIGPLSAWPKRRESYLGYLGFFAPRAAVFLRRRVKRNGDLRGVR